MVGTPRVCKDTLDTFEGKQAPARCGHRHPTHQDLPELFLPLRLLFQQLLQQGAEGPALLRDHLL